MFVDDDDDDDDKDFDLDNKKTKPMTIYNKHKIFITRISKGSYDIRLQMFNPHINLYSLVDFGTLPYIGILNKNVFETISIHDVTESSAIIFILAHDFFKTFGIQQKYLFLKSHKHENEQRNSKSFTVTNIESKPFIQREKLSQLIIQSLAFKVSKLDSNSIDINCHLSFAIPFPLPLFVEKLAIKIVVKLIKVTKKHFESMKLFQKF